jgi:hypothetical protein
LGSTTVTSNHRHFALAIEKLRLQYEREIVQYDGFMAGKLDTIDLEKPSEDNLEIANEWTDISETVNSTKYALVVLIATYIEAIVNFYLSQKMTTDQFDAIERCKLVDKWSGIIGMVVPGYKLKKGKELYSSLASLITTRNGLIHHKPKVRRMRVDIHQGSKLKHLDDNTQTDRILIRRWVRLPEDLLENLLEHDDSYQAKVTENFSKPVST